MSVCECVRVCVSVCSLSLAGPFSQIDSRVQVEKNRASDLYFIYLMASYSSGILQPTQTNVLPRMCTVCVLCVCVCLSIASYDRRAMEIFIRRNMENASQSDCSYDAVRSLVKRKATVCAA